MDWFNDAAITRSIGAGRRLIKTVRNVSMKARVVGTCPAGTLQPQQQWQAEQARVTRQLSFLLLGWHPLFSRHCGWALSRYIIIVTVSDCRLSHYYLFCVMGLWASPIVLIQNYRLSIVFVFGTLAYWNFKRSKLNIVILLKAVLFNKKRDRIHNEFEVFFGYF